MRTVCQQMERLGDDFILFFFYMVNLLGKFLTAVSRLYLLGIHNIVFTFEKSFGVGFQLLTPQADALPASVAQLVGAQARRPGGCGLNPAAPLSGGKTLPGFF